MLCHCYRLFNDSYQYPLHFCLFYLFKEVQVVHKKLELSNERIMQIQESRPYIENTPLYVIIDWIDLGQEQELLQFW